MTEFKSGDRVRMMWPSTVTDEERYAYGTVVIVTEYSCKVMFDRDTDPSYWYYLKEDLEIVLEGEVDYNG